MDGTGIDLFSKLLHPALRPYLLSHGDALLKAGDNQDSVLKDLYEIAMKVDLEPLSSDGLRAYLAKHEIEGHLEKRIVAEYASSLTFQHHELEAVYDSMKRILCRNFIDTEYSRSTNDPVSFIKGIQEFEGAIEPFESSDSDTFSKVRFGDIDTSEIMEQLGEPVKSSLTCLNRISPIDGWIPSQIIMVIAPPSCGKSIFMMNEVVSFLRQGKKVLYCALGDLKPFDFVSRFTTIVTGISKNLVAMNLTEYYKLALKMLPELKDNLTIEFIAPDVYSPKEHYTMLKRGGDLEEFDAFFIDYDSNYRDDKDNLYQKGDAIYNTLYRISSMPAKFVFVASQPKVGEWGNEVLGLGSAGESSRKTHVVDMQITLSRFDDCVNAENHIGNISVVKNRKGGRIIQPYFLDHDGIFKEIDTRFRNYIKREPQMITLNPNNKDMMVKFVADEVFHENAGE